MFDICFICCFVFNIYTEEKEREKKDEYILRPEENNQTPHLGKVLRENISHVTGITSFSCLEQHPFWEDKSTIV